MKYFKKFSNTFLIKFSVVFLKSFPTFFLITFQKFSDVFLIGKRVTLMYHLFHMQHYNKYYLKDIDFNKVIIKYNSKDYIYTYDLPITNMSNNFMIAYINKQDIYTFRLLESFRNYEIVYHPLTLKQKIDVL